MRHLAWSQVCIGGFTPLNELKEIVFGEFSVWRQHPFATTRRKAGSNSTSRAHWRSPNYRLTPSAVVITHTETPRALRGRGIASELVHGALQLIRADGLKVIAGCSFVVDYLRKHPEFADLAG